MKVLLVKTSSMGDVIHTFPAVREALRRRPDLILDWCVEPAFVDLVRLLPGIRAAQAAPIRNWLTHPLSGETLAEIRALRRKLRAERYDFVLDAQGLIKSALLSKLAGVDVAGYDRASARESVATLLYDRRLKVQKNLHAIHRSRVLFGAALGYRPDLLRADGALTSGQAAGPMPRAFLLHGTSRPSKEWPLKNWIAVAAGAVARGMIPVLTWSNDRERRTAEAIADAVAETAVIPKSPLSSIAVEIERSALVIGVDTGLMHLADAYGRPTIALFLGSSPALTRPLGSRSVVLPSDAGKLPETPRRRDREAAALDVVGPDEVLHTADRLLAGLHPPDGS